MGKLFRFLWRVTGHSGMWFGISLLWASGGAFVTLVLQTVLGWVRGHQDLTALLICAGTILILIVAGLMLRKPWGHSENKDTLHAHPQAANLEPLLHIVFAKWGIGGNAYKDVTETVRGYAKSDSIDMPVQVGVLGDPFPNSPKHLEVSYIFCRKWNLRIPEHSTLALPEPIGKEQSNPTYRQAQLDELHSPEDILASTLNDMEYQLFILAESEYMTLPWSHKLALKRICERVIYPVDDFIADMAKDGLTNPKLAVDSLIARGFVEEQNRRLQPSISKIQFMGTILKKHPLC